MKKKLFTLMTLLLCLCSTAWAQTLIYSNGFENGTDSWGKSSMTSGPDAETANIRTGTKSIKYVCSTSKGYTTKQISFTNNTYIHGILWAKASSTKSVYLALNSDNGSETNIGNSGWTRVTHSYNYTSSTGNKNVRLYMNDTNAGISIYVDDAIFYYSSSSSIDLTKPTQPTSATATTSAISWTNGSDTGDGATGIQKTLIFKRTSGTADDLTLNDQGIYSLTSTEGPSTDQSGHWTLVNASVAANATSYAGTFTAGDVYAIVHRDLAYNYSTPTYVTVASNKTTPTLALGAGSGSADIADGRTAFTLPVLTSDPDDAAIKDHISYSSSATDVATIDESTGAITLKKAGETTITATFEGDDNYNEASAEYVLTVTNSTDFEVDLRSESGGSFDIAADGTHVAAGTGVVSLTMTGYNGADHGWNPGTTITVPVTGPTKISLGTCKFGNGAVTVKNSSNETVLSFSTNDGTCYHSNTTNNVISRYYDGAATTLTISVNNYLPYVKVSSVGLDEVEYPVTFDISGASADALSAAPATAMVQRAGNYTIPANSTIYKEGNTLTGWNDGTTTYNIGAAIENVTSAKTLTPVFTENTKSLNGHTQEVTLSWPFGKGNGAPVLDYYDATGLYVIQADVDGEEIDVKMEVDATAQLGTYKAMLRNINRADNDVWAQIVEGLKLTVPSESGATVALTAYGNISTSTIDGSTEYTGTGTTSVSKEITSTTETVDVVLMDGGGYFSYLTVTMPAPPTCETPTITPATFNTDDQEVTISCATDGATIYYTTDGTDPTTSSDVYDADNKPTISSTTTFKAYAVKAGAFDSEVATATITRTTQVVKTWDFTNWSDATKTGVKGDATNWSQYEKTKSGGINYGENGRSNINAISSGSSLQYSSTNITETDGLTFAAGAYGLGLIFNMGKATVSSTEYTYHGSSYLWLYSNSSKITIPNVLAGATIEIATESHNGGDDRYVSLSGVDNINRTQGATSGDAAKAYQVCKWTIPSAGNILVTPSKGLHIYYIKVTQDVPTVPATVQSYGWATYIPTNNVEFAEGDAYVVTDINTSTGATTVAPVTQVPANTPVLLKGEGTKNIAIINTTPAAPSKNLMEVYDGSDKGTKVPYVLAKNGDTAGFKKWTGAASVIKDRAVMWLDSEIALSREFFFLDGETTGISNVDVNANANFDANAPMYNLAGQKVTKSYKGVVIQNGKKYMNK